MNVRFIWKMLGMMSLLETLFMLAVMGVAFFYGDGDGMVFAFSSAVMLCAGLALCWAGRRADENAGKREGMLTVTLTWTLFSFFGMLPFYLGGYIDNVTDAYFETMSGFTTTGATVFGDVESLPHGILLWRSLTQWQGGMGVIVFTVALMPIFGGSAMQLCDAETAGIVRDRFLPRVTQVAKRLSGVYLLLTCLATGLLWLGPMNFFDALNHGLTAIATGGASTRNAGIAYWDSAYVEYILIVFMLAGATNMTLIYFCFNGKPEPLFRDEELRWFFFFAVVCVLVTGVWLCANGWAADVESAFRKSAFQVVGLITTCGFATENYVEWGAFFWLIALMLMVVCGCAGSTSGGLKMGRFMILVKNLSGEFKKQTHPHAVIPVRMNGQVVSEGRVHRVLAFVFAYIALIVFSCFVLALEGMSFEEAVSTAISTIGNIGIRLSSTGQAGSFADIPAVSKWFLSFLMLTGRLEIFTVLTILLPGFWKQ
jgi:trk system potassium uptake protein TrkH